MTTLVARYEKAARRADAIHKQIDELTRLGEVVPTDLLDKFAKLDDVAYCKLIELHRGGWPTTVQH